MPEQSSALDYSDNVHEFCEERKFLSDTSWNAEFNKMEEAEKKFLKNKTSVTLATWAESTKHAEKYVILKEKHYPNHRHTADRKHQLDRVHAKLIHAEVEICIIKIDSNEEAYDGSKESLRLWKQSLKTASECIKKNALLDYRVDVLQEKFKAAEDKYNNKHSWVNWCCTFWECRDPQEEKPKTELDKAEAPGYLLM